MPKTQLKTAPLGAAVQHALEPGVNPFAEQQRIGVIVYSPMGSGILTRHLAQVERLKAVAALYDTTPGAVAVAWTLRSPVADGALVAFRRPGQVDPILAAAGLEVRAEDVEDIERRER